MMSNSLHFANSRAVQHLRVGEYRIAVRLLKEALRICGERSNEEEESSEESIQEEYSKQTSMSVYSAPLDILPNQENIHGDDIFARPFLFISDESIVQSSVVLLFNVALTYHLTGTNGNLHKAKSLYQCAGNVIECNDFPPTLSKVALAIQVNLSSIHLILCDLDTTAIVRKQFLSIFFSSIRHCSPEEGLFFMLQEVIYRSQHLTVAPAA